MNKRLTSRMEEEKNYHTNNRNNFNGKKIGCGGHKKINDNKVIDCPCKKFKPIKNLRDWLIKTNKELVSQPDFKTENFDDGDTQVFEK